MAGKIVIPFLSEFNGKGIKEAISSLGQLGSSLKGVSGLVGGLAGAGLGATAFNFIGDSVDQAKLLQGQMMALDTVFGANNKQIHDFIANSEQLALSHQEAAQAATFLGTNLKSAGFPMDDVVKKTEKLLKLSTDLAITYGYPVQEALTAVAAMFRGEYDPIEKFGVAIKQSQVNTVLAAEGLGKLKGQALLNASTMVRYNLLLSHSTDAQGAMIRQADTLVVKQAKLTASFHDQQAALGEALLPSLTMIAQKFLIMSKGLAPALQKSFQTLGVIINKLFQSFRDAKPVIEALGIAFGALAVFAGQIATVISRNIVQVGLMAIAFIAVAKAIKLAQTAVIYWRVLSLEAAAGTLKFAAGTSTLRLAMAELGTTLKGVMANNLVGLLLAGAFAISEWAGASRESVAPLQKFREEAQKLYVAMHPEGMQGNDLWNYEADIQNIEKGLKKTSDAQDKADKKYSEGWKKWHEHKQALWRIAKAARDGAIADRKAQAEADAKAAAEAAKQLAKDTATMRETLKKFKTVFAPQEIKASLGVMEQSVVESFGKISDYLASAINNNTLTKKAAGAFKAYAAMESKALRVIAKQRDAVKGKIDLAQTLIGDVKKAVIDFGNITNALSDATNSVTTSVSYIAGKFQVLVSSSGKGAGGAKKILDNLQSVVDKAKTYAKNLQLLKKMNLATGLYDQIIQAGIDTGGATAAALVEGGQGAVSAINATFAELSKTAEGIGTTAAEVMYGQGVDLTNGLIDGLLSQDKALKTAAQTLAEAFSGAFNTTLNKTLGTGKTKVTFDKIDTSGLASGTAKQLLTNVGAAAGGANVTVTVNAGMGADGVAIGAEIVKVIKKYEKANGKVFSK